MSQGMIDELAKGSVALRCRIFSEGVHPRPFRGIQKRSSEPVAPGKGHGGECV